MPMLQLRDAISEVFAAANALQLALGLMTVGRLCETLFQSVASAALSGKPDSKAEQESLAAGDVSQRLLVRRAKELIAQAEPAAQLWWHVCCRTRPTLVREVCVEFRKARILSEGQQCDPRAF